MAIVQEHGIYSPTSNATLSSDLTHYGRSDVNDTLFTACFPNYSQLPFDEFIKNIKIRQYFVRFLTEKTWSV